jgi:hypothetical protein
MQRCILLALAIIPVLVSGCAHYGYSHSVREVPIYAGSPLWELCTGTNSSTAPNPFYVRDTKDRTGSTMFFIMGKAAQIDSMTLDQDYMKKLTIGGLEGKVDGESLKAGFEGLGGAVGEAMRAYMGLPPLPIPASGSTVPAAAVPLVNSFKSGLIRYLPAGSVAVPAPR